MNRKERRAAAARTKRPAERQCACCAAPADRRQPEHSGQHLSVNPLASSQDAGAELAMALREE